MNLLLIIIKNSVTNRESEVFSERNNYYKEEYYVLYSITHSVINYFSQACHFLLILGHHVLSFLPNSSVVAILRPTHIEPNRPTVNGDPLSA